MAVKKTEENHENPPVSSSKMARALTPWLGATLAIIGIIWASGIIVDLGIALITEQVICGILGLTFAIIYLNVPAGKRKNNLLPWYDAIASRIGFVLGWDFFFRDPLLLDQMGYMPKE